MTPKNKLKIAQEYSHHLYLLSYYHDIMIIGLYDLKPDGEFISVILEEVEVDLNVNYPRV
jgi:hypothetical protein